MMLDRDALIKAYERETFARLVFPYFGHMPNNQWSQLMNWVYGLSDWLEGRKCEKSS